MFPLKCTKKMLVRHIVCMFTQLSQTSITSVCVKVDVLLIVYYCLQHSGLCLNTMYLSTFFQITDVHQSGVKDLNSFALETCRNPYACASAFIQETQAYKSFFINDKLCPLQCLHTSSTLFSCKSYPISHL